MTVRTTQMLPESRLNFAAVTQQLNDGVRLLQSQAHNNNGVIQLCHTSCSLFNGGTLADYLGKGETSLNSKTLLH